jgi:hypothetical protein
MIMSKQRQPGPVHRSDPPREVRLACTARAALAFKSDILFLVNLSVFPSAAARSEAEETIPKIPRRLLDAFNRTYAVAVPDAAFAVPAILAEGSLPSAAEAAAVAVFAEFRRKAEETRELHASSPGAGEGNCRRVVVIDTSHSDLTVSAVSRHALTFLSVVFRGMGIRGLTLIGRGHSSEFMQGFEWPADGSGRQGFEVSFQLGFYQGGSGRD